MPTSSRLLRFALALFIFGHWLFSPPATRAQTAPLVITARAGFDGYYKDGAWIPVRVSVANNGPDLEGSLRVSIPRGYANAEIVFERLIQLPTQSRREFFLYVAPEGYLTDLRVEFFDTQSKTVRATTVARLVQAAAADMVYGVLASSPSAFGGLADLDPLNGTAFVAQLDPADLPPAVKGWQGLDVLVISDVDTGQFSPEQRAALAGWVATGGRLIVAGGPSWQKTAAGLQAVLPLLPAGTQTLGGLAALGAFAALPAPVGNVVVATGALSPDANTLATAEGLPLIVSRSSGFGEVFFLAADPAFAPLKGWDGVKEVLRNLLGRAQDKPMWASGFRNWSPANDAVKALPTLELPSTWQICGFLFVYLLIIGPLNYLVLSRLKRRELAWLTIPAIVFVFSGVTYLTGYQLRGTRATLHQLALVQVWPDSDQAQVDELLGLYTPRRAAYDLEFPTGFLVRPLPVYSGYGTPANVHLQQGDQTLLTGLLADVGGVESFVVQGQVPTPRFESNLTLETVNGVVVLQGTVTNQSALSLSDVVLLAPGGSGSVQRLGDFKPGETQTLAFSLYNSRATQLSSSPLAVPMTGGAISSPAYYPPSVYDTTIDDILGSSNYYNDRLLFRRYSLLSAAMDSYGVLGRGSGVYLAGWTEAAPVPARVTNRGFDTIDLTLYVIDLNPTWHLGGAVVSVPPALMTWAVLDPAQSGSPTPYDMYIYPGYDDYSLQFTPVFPLAFSQVRDLTLHLTSYGALGSSGLNLSLWDFTENVWVLYKNVAWGDLALEAPARFVGPSGEIHVKVNISSNSTASSINIETLDFTLTVEK